MTEIATGRRAQNRVTRNSELLLAATEIIETEGLNGLTMQAVAQRVGCAVGTIYTYFDSKSSLLAVLQVEAMKTMLATFERSAEAWDKAISEADLDAAAAVLVRLVASSRIFVALGEIHPKEFDLLQLMISTRDELTTAKDQDAVLPVALALINTLLILIDEAILVGALLAPPADPATGKIRDSDSSVSRTIRWAGGINGALLVSNASNVGSYNDENLAALFNGRQLALSLTDDLLLGWGASRQGLESACAFVDQLIATDRLVVLPTLEITDLTTKKADSKDTVILSELSTL